MVRASYYLPQKEGAFPITPNSLHNKVIKGLQKLAFGPVNDAVILLFLDDPDPESLKALDLFSVSELRRPKGGGMEIKFADRLTALQRLNDLSHAIPNPQDPFLPLCNALRELPSEDS